MSENRLRINRVAAMSSVSLLWNTVYLAQIVHEDFETTIRYEVLF